MEPFVLWDNITYREKGILWQSHYRYQDHIDMTFPGTPSFIHKQVYQDTSSSVNDFSIDPCSSLGIVFNATIPQSLNLQLAEGNALEVLWQDSTRSACLVSSQKIFPELVNVLEIIHLHVSGLVLERDLISRFKDGALLDIMIL